MTDKNVEWLLPTNLFRFPRYDQDVIPGYAYLNVSECYYGWDIIDHNGVVNRNFKDSVFYVAFTTQTKTPTEEEHAIAKMLGFRLYVPGGD